MVTNTFIEGFEPGSQRNTSYDSIAQYAGIWHQFDEAKTAAQGSIQQSDRTISCIHRSNYIDVVRNPERLSRQREQNRFPAFVLFKDAEQFTKDARDISSIDFVDDQVELAIWHGLGIFTKIFKDTILQREMHLAVDSLRPTPFQKIFISICRMEAAHPDQAMRIVVLSKNKGFLFTCKLIEWYAKAGTRC